MFLFIIPTFAETLSFKFDGSGFISDGAEILKDNDANEIAFYLDYVKKQKKYTVLIVTIDTVEDIPASRIAQIIAQNANVQDKDDLMVFLVSPNNGKIGIELGEHMKSDLSYDALRKIIQTRIAPAFNSGDYSEAMKLGIYSISELLEPSIAFIGEKNAVTTTTTPSVMKLGRAPIDNTNPSKQIAPNIIPLFIILLGLFALWALIIYSNSCKKYRTITYRRCGFGTLFGCNHALFEQEILERK